MRPCEACRCCHGAMRDIHAPAQGVPQSRARSCRKRCRYVLPPAHSLSAHFQAAGRPTSPSVAASMRPCEACRCCHGARRDIHAPAQGVLLPRARSCRKRCRYVLPPAHSLSAHFQAAGRPTSPSVAASMKLCEACRCRHGAKHAIHAPAQGLPHSRATQGAAANAAVVCSRRRTVCPLIFKQLVGRQAPVSRLA